jgi:hypothetical protein
MTQDQTNLEQIFETQIQTLALTLRPGTVDNYRCTARQFLAYLRAAFPQLHQLSELRRDPHLLGWFRWLSERQPPLCNKTRIGRLILLRCLLNDLASNGHTVPLDLIRGEDFPPEPRYLPRPLSLKEDQLLQQELLRADDLYANASCSSAPPGSASANASICRWIACVRWGPSSGRFMSPSANCTRNAWCRPIPRCGGS